MIKARLRKAILLFTALAAAGGAGAAAPPPKEAAVTAIVGATVIPMNDGAAALSDHTVIIQDDRIAAVGPRATTRVPAGARVVDGAGAYVTPGLADMHVHLEYLEDPDVLKLFLANGVTTVRSMDGRPFMLDWRRRVKAGALPGPAIVTAGPVIDGSPPARDDNLSIADAAGARAAVKAQADAGYDFIKVYTNLSPENYRAVLAEARQRGLRVAGHVPRGVPLEEAAAAHWSIEHLADFARAVQQEGAKTPGWARGYLAGPLDPARTKAFAEQMAGRDLWTVPTSVERDRAIAPSATLDRWQEDPSVRELPRAAVGMWRGGIERFNGRLDADDWKLVEAGRRNRIALIRAMHEAGVKIVVGTDTPNAFVVPGSSIHLELANFVEAGFTPMQALAAATSEPARMLGPLSDAGSLAVGKRADLLVLSADPRTSLAALQQRRGVMAAGRWYPEPELQKLRRDLTRR